MFRLVDGAHRYAAAEQLDWQTIRCEVRDLDDTAAEMIEVVTGLGHAPLNPIDRGYFMAARERVYRRDHLDAPKHGGDRTSPKFQRLKLGADFDFAERFAKVAAKKTGLSETSVHYALTIGRGLTQEAANRLRPTKFAYSTTLLVALCKEPPAMQKMIAEKLASGQANTIHEAKFGKEVKMPLAAPDQRAAAKILVNAFTRAWDATADHAEARQACLQYLRNDGYTVR